MRAARRVRRAGRGNPPGAIQAGRPGPTPTTLAWDKGGITCECDLAPLCRHHHRAKQAEGWRLEQPEPGVLRWQTPAGRFYRTTPTAYPM